MVLFVAGAIPFLMGIVYTTIFPSNDPHVIAFIVVGVVFLIGFALWENRGAAWDWIKHHLTPTHLFTSGKGRDLTAPCVALAIINS